MQGILRRFRVTWGRPKHHGVSGNFSTVVILTGIVIGAYIFTGGGYPQVYPNYTTIIEGQPLATQPRHSGEPALTMRELRMRKLPPGSENPPGGNPEQPGTVCDKQAIIFLVDASTSMKGVAGGDPGSDSKLHNVQTALTDFTTDFSSDGLIGLFTFSSPNGNEPQERIPISVYRDASAGFPNAVNSINPPDNAATYMRQGFSFVQSKLALAQQRFPDYSYNLVFLSDGVPEEQDNCVDQYTIAGTPGSCDTSGNNDSRNFDIRYDPTDYWALQGRLPAAQYPDIPRQIKDAGVNIYSIVIKNATDTAVFPALESLMQRISSGSGFYYDSTGATDMSNIFSTIKDQACTGV